MKKISFKRNNFFVLFIVLVLIVVLLNVFPRQVRGFFYWFSNPIQKHLWGAGDSASDFFEGVFGFISLKNRMEELEQKNQGLIAEIIRLKELEEENKSLKEALNINLQDDHSLLLADIVSKDISEDIIIINKGLRDGVNEGMAVITESKVLVGRVIEAFEKYSKIMLSSHQEMSFDIKIKQEEKEISAVAEGQGSERIFLNFVPHQDDIFEGDIVVTSSKGGIFPDSLLVGKIKRYQKNDIDPFQIAELDTYLNISEINKVFLIND